MVCLVRAVHITTAYGKANGKLNVLCSSLNVSLSQVTTLLNQQPQDDLPIKYSWVKALRLLSQLSSTPSHQGQALVLDQNLCFVLRNDNWGNCSWLPEAHQQWVCIFSWKRKKKNTYQNIETGVLESLILASVLPFTSATGTGDCVG